MGLYYWSKMCVDEETVRLLQFRVPSASSVDKIFTSYGMDNGILFCGLVDQEARKKVEQSLSSLPVVIPSILTFHENMKYITIGAKILKAQVDVPAERRNKCQRRESTLYERLFACWDKSCTPLMETGEGQFRPLVDVPSPWLAFSQLFVSVLRQFPNLSTESPLRDFRWEAMPASINPHYLHMLHRRACLLDFFELQDYRRSESTL